MKTEGQVRHKLQQVTFRHLQRTVRTALSRRPENCSHNAVLRLAAGELRFCTLRETANGAFTPCDILHGGLDQAAKCPDFSCSNTKDESRKEFESFLKTSDVATIAAQYPDVAALLWALGESDPVEVPSEDPDLVVVHLEPPEPAPKVVHLRVLQPGDCDISTPQLIHHAVAYGLFGTYP